MPDPVPLPIPSHLVAAVEAVLRGEAVVPARAGITPAMEIAAEEEMMRQYRASDWEDAKDMAEGLNCRAIYRAMTLASPYAAAPGEGAR